MQTHYYSSRSSPFKYKTHFKANYYCVWHSERARRMRTMNFLELKISTFVRLTLWLDVLYRLRGTSTSARYCTEIFQL